MKRECLKSEFCIHVGGPFKHHFYWVLLRKGEVRSQCLSCHQVVALISDVIPAVLCSCSLYMLYFREKSVLLPLDFCSVFFFEKAEDNCDIVTVCNFKKKNNTRSRINENGWECTVLVDRNTSKVVAWKVCHRLPITKCK